MQKALSDKKGTTDLSIPIKGKGKIGPSLAHLSSSEEKGECLTQKSVELDTLDDFCAENNINTINFIKCDIEGAEMLFLAGAGNMIDKCKPTVLIEVDRDHLKRFNSSPEELCSFFTEKGYASFILKDNKFKKVDSIEYDHNYFFVHKDNQAINNL